MPRAEFAPVKFFNLRLDGMTHDNRKTTRGEVVRFFSMVGALCLSPGVPLQKCWQQQRGPKDCYPPLAMGQFGMGKKRFLLFKQLAGKMYELNADTVETQNDWRYSEMVVDVFNEHMTEPGGRWPMLSPKA
eukprot:2656666-Prymnesium_polylepis.1